MNLRETTSSKDFGNWVDGETASVSHRKMKGWLLTVLTFQPSGAELLIGYPEDGTPTDGKMVTNLMIPDSVEGEPG